MTHTIPNLAQPSLRSAGLEWEEALSEDDAAIDRAFAYAVREALLDHKRAGNPVAIWADGKVKIVPPEEIILPEEAE